MWEWIEGETGEEVDGLRRDWMEEDKVEAEEGTVEQEGEEDGLLGGGKLGVYTLFGLDVVGWVAGPGAAYEC